MTSTRGAVPSWSYLALVVCIAIALGRIVSTYEVFSETYDEGVHIAAGMELLDRGTFTYEPKHPPLVRVAVALGPYLSGIRSQGVRNIWGEGRAIIHSVNPDRTLFLARLGVLPFFILACCMVWWWTRRWWGDGAAVAATALFTTAPPVLAHSSVATTDIGLTATLLAVALAAILWLESPTQKRSVWLGIAGAAVLTAKLSSVAYFGVMLLLVVGLRLWWGWRQPAEGVPGGRGARLAGLVSLEPMHLRRLLVVAPVAFLMVWGVYAFQVGRLRGIPFPLTTLIQGVKDLALHNDLGQASFLLGRAYYDGSLLFFPVGLAVKTPLTMLALGIAGVVLITRQAWRARAWDMTAPVLLAVAVLGVAIPARINLGVRHILPVYAVLAIAGGVAAVHAWQRWTRARARVALTGLAVAGLWSTFTIHPDYLAYFNEVAGKHPERVLVDSDLDWGQDLRRLRDTLRSRGIDSVTTAYFGSGVPLMYGVPEKHRWHRGDTVHGWFVVSQTLRQRGTATLVNSQWALYPDAFQWLDAYQPEARIGKTLLLYRLP